MKKNTGFTLIELIVTVAIAAIVMAIGIPSFRETINQNQLTTYSNQFIGSLNLARSEAIKRGSRVTLCPSSSGTNCQKIGYENGWIIFNDQNSNAEVDGEAIVRIYEKMPEGMTLTGNANVETYVSYWGDGASRLNGSPGGFQSGTLTLCKNGKARKIILSSPGRLRVESDLTCP